MADKTPPPALTGDEFRRLGHALVEQIAAFYDSLPERPVTRDTARDAIRDMLGRNGLPADGRPADQLLEETARLLFEHSLHNGHPRFMGYITSSAAPLGALGDLLAASVNANVGLWDLAPVASELEAQTVRWLAELIGYPRECGGLMVSGGNMANLIGFFAARRAQTPWNIREQGLYGDRRRLTLYASTETHTWIQKAADLSGLGTNDIRWIETDAERRMRTDVLEERIDADLGAGRLPFLVIGAAGTVSTGAIDPLPEIAAICERRALWFHVDGAYGAPAAALPEASAALRGLALADSVALDPHKWLYCPIEAGCTLVRNPQHLLDAYSFHPDYYRLESAEIEPKLNYYEYGIQNSRGFRALKVWLALKHVGRDAYVDRFRTDIALAKRLFDAARDTVELEARTHNLSLTTFRYVPVDIPSGDEAAEQYLNTLNQALVARLQKSGEAFLSNAVVGGAYLLRACIVNFRTTAADIDAIVAAVTRMGRELDRELRGAGVSVSETRGRESRD
jgi:glutamate/tyrosine decarboxylase-like PLP-dependent enzyme